MISLRKFFLVNLHAPYIPHSFPREFTITLSSVLSFVPLSLLLTFNNICDTFFVFPGLCFITPPWRN